MSARRARLAAALVAAGVLGPPAVRAQEEPAQAPGDIRVLPLRPFSPPAPEEIDLPHGARLLVLSDHAEPLVDGRLVFRAGSAWDPADRIGLARLLADVLRTGGSEATSGEALDDRLDSLGAQLAIVAHREELRIEFQCVSDDLPEVLGFVRELLVSPAYPEATLAKARVRLQSELLRRSDDIGALADQALAHVVYGSDSPFAREPDPNALEEIDREDLLAAHRAQLGPDRLLVGLVGDVDAGTCEEGMRAVLADISPVGPPPDLPAASFLQPSRTRVHVVDRPGVTQTEIRLTSPGVPRRNQDASALELWSWVVGVGGMTNRMMVRVRTELGLAYHVGALYRSPWSRPGFLYAVCGTRNDAVGAAVASMLDVLANGLTEIPAQELEGGRSRLLNAKVFETDSAVEVLERAIDLRLHDYPPGYVLENQERLMRLGPTEVREAVARHLDPERLTILAVGPAEAIVDQLATFGPVTVVDPRGRPLEAAREESVVDRLFESVGGRARWSELDWIEWEEILVIAPPDTARMEVPLHHWRSLDGRYLRVEQTLGGETLASVLHPDGAWRQTARGVVDLSAREREAMRHSADRSIYQLLHDLAVGSRSATADEDSALWVVDDSGEPTCRLELDADGRPARVIYVHEGAELTFEYLDWTAPTEEGGWPHARRIVQRPQGIVRRVTRFAPGTGDELEESLFERP